MIHLHYIDDALLVAEKPAGLLSVPGRSAENQDCVVARLQALYPDALTVHRLDQVTRPAAACARQGHAGGVVDAVRAAPGRQAV
jgi:23S rRNA-/tRNA-specific pseudouridylate synthase